MTGLRRSPRVPRASHASGRSGLVDLALDKILARAERGLPRPSKKDKNPEVRRLGEILARWRKEPHPNGKNALAAIEERFPGYLQDRMEANFAAFAGLAAAGLSRPAISSKDPDEARLGQAIAHLVKGESARSEPLVERFEREHPGWLGDALGAAVLDLRRRAEAGSPPLSREEARSDASVAAIREAVLGRGSEKRQRAFRLLAALERDHPGSTADVSPSARDGASRSGPPPLRAPRAAAELPAAPTAAEIVDDILSGPPKAPLALPRGSVAGQASVLRALMDAPVDLLRSRVLASAAAEAETRDPARAEAFGRGRAALAIELDRCGYGAEIRSLLPGRGIGGRKGGDAR